MAARRWIQAGVLVLLVAGLCLAAPADSAPDCAKELTTQVPFAGLCADLLAWLLSLDPLAGLLTALSARVLLPAL